MDTKASIERAISLLGGPVKAAKALGVDRYQTVQQWIANGNVPAKYCPEIERLLRGEVLSEEMNPTVDWGYYREYGSRSCPSPPPTYGEGAKHGSPTAEPASTAAEAASVAQVPAGAKRTAAAEFVGGARG